MARASARSSPPRAESAPAQPIATPSRSRHFAESYFRFSLRAFGDVAAPSAARAHKLRHSLEQAHLDFLPDAYLAVSWMNTALAALATFLLVGVAVGVGFVAGTPPPLPVVIVLLLMPILVGGSCYVAHLVYPDYRAGERGRMIDRDLPYAVNFIAAMSSAGVVPTVLLRDLAREKTYGEVSREVAWLVRDIDLLGIDLLTAIQRATARTPSRKFQEFLQGAKTTILSGGELKAYFVQKADQYMGENRRVQKEFIDSLGLMAESYVTVVIAGPLFMLVMLSIMLLIGNSTLSSEAFLFLLTFIMLPIAHALFAWIIKNMAPEE